MKLNCKIAGLKSVQGTEFENSLAVEFCTENGISHKFFASRTSQRNGVFERKSRTLIEISMTMLIAVDFQKAFRPKL